MVAAQKTCATHGTLANGTKSYLRLALALENFEPHPGIQQKKLSDRKWPSQKVGALNSGSEISKQTSTSVSTIFLTFCHATGLPLQVLAGGILVENVLRALNLLPETSRFSLPGDGK